MLPHEWPCYRSSVPLTYGNLSIVKANLNQSAQDTIPTGLCLPHMTSHYPKPSHLALSNSVTKSKLPCHAHLSTPSQSQWNYSRSLCLADMLQDPQQIIQNLTVSCLLHLTLALAGVVDKLLSLTSNNKTNTHLFLSLPFHRYKISFTMERVGQIKAKCAHSRNTLRNPFEHWLEY
jgi:hypothetical protein